MLERGKIISYGACGMPYYVGGDVNDIEDLMKTPVGIVRSPGYFKNVKDIDVLIQTEATAIDRQCKVVKVKKLDLFDIDLSYAPPLMRLYLT